VIVEILSPDEFPCWMSRFDGVVNDGRRFIATPEQ
jgi:hypothetical protein